MLSGISLVDGRDVISTDRNVGAGNPSIPGSFLYLLQHLVYRSLSDAAKHGNANLVVLRKEGVFLIAFRQEEHDVR